MSRPRVLMVYPDDGGGGPMHVRVLKEALRDDVHWEEMPLDPVALHRPAGWLRTPWEIRRRLAGQPAIAHAQGVRTAAAVLPAAKLHRSRFVVTVQGLHSIRRSRSRFVRLMNKVVLGSADLVLVTGASDGRTIVEERLAPSARVRVIRAAFEPRDAGNRDEARRTLDIPDDAIVVLWLGRFSHEKDPMTFARAISRVGSGSNVLAIMAGDGPLFPQLRSFVEREGIGKRVRLPGWLVDPGPAVSACDIYVNTSRWEGMPHSALEAGGAGRALLLTDCAGNRDLAGAGVPAALVPVGDEERLAEEIERLAADPGELRATGEEAATVIGRTFTMQNLREDVLAAYREVGSGT